MTYAMTFDNSWEIMTEDEMHDVNGGGTLRIGFGVMLTPGLVAGLAVLGVKFLAALKLSKSVHFVNISTKTLLKAAGWSFVAGLFGAANFIVGILTGIVSVGQALAHMLDYADGNYNGRIRF